MNIGESWPNSSTRGPKGSCLAVRKSRFWSRSKTPAFRCSIPRPSMRAWPPNGRFCQNDGQRTIASDQCQCRHHRDEDELAVINEGWRAYKEKHIGFDQKLPDSRFRLSCQRDCVPLYGPVQPYSGLLGTRRFIPLPRGCFPLPFQMARKSAGRHSLVSPENVKHSCRLQDGSSV